MPQAGAVHHPKGYARYASIDAAIDLDDTPTAGVVAPDGAVKALIQNQHASIAVRWRDDGTAPTTTEGMLLAAGQTLEYEGSLNTFKAIGASAGGGPLVVSYYGI